MQEGDKSRSVDRRKEEERIWYKLTKERITKDNRKG
jgi:hypothetical protein